MTTNKVLTFLEHVGICSDRPADRHRSLKAVGGAFGD